MIFIFICSYLMGFLFLLSMTFELEKEELKLKLQSDPHKELTVTNRRHTFDIAIAAVIKVNIL